MESKRKSTEIIRIDREKRQGDIFPTREREIETKCGFYGKISSLSSPSVLSI